MSSVLSMALTTMLGSACGTSMANINGRNAALCNTGNCPQVVRYQKGSQGLNSMLSQIGVSMAPGNSQCGIN